VLFAFFGEQVWRGSHRHQKCSDWLFDDCTGECRNPATAPRGGTCGARRERFRGHRPHSAARSGSVEMAARRRESSGGHIDAVFRRWQRAWLRWQLARRRWVARAPAVGVESRACRWWLRGVATAGGGGAGGAAGRVDAGLEAFTVRAPASRVALRACRWRRRGVGTAGGGVAGGAGRRMDAELEAFTARAPALEIELQACRCRVRGVADWREGAGDRAAGV
jgi:hypothetical protein